MRKLAEYKRISRPSDIGIYSVFEKCEARLIEGREELRREEF